MQLAAGWRNRYDELGNVNLGFSRVCHTSRSIRNREKKTIVK